MEGFRGVKGRKVNKSLNLICQYIFKGKVRGLEDFLRDWRVSYNRSDPFNGKKFQYSKIRVL